LADAYELGQLGYRKNAARAQYWHRRYKRTSRSLIKRSRPQT
jgi:hypothetical protein